MHVAGIIQSFSTFDSINNVDPLELQHCGTLKALVTQVNGKRLAFIGTNGDAHALLFILFAQGAVVLT